MIGSDEYPLFAETIAWEDAQASLAEQGLGDGLPLVPPTAARLQRMLAGVRAPERSYGPVPPLFGELTASAIAYNCVLAGCGPAELAVVLTALAACREPEFNLLGLLTTTGTPAVAVIVHGPAVGQLGMNAGTNCLGPGNRANACIGRAVQLSLVHIGGARPGVADMATMGQPGKYAFCFAEGEHALMPPLHARRGFAAAESAVTVLGVSGTQEVLPFDGRDTPEAILRPVAAAMRAALTVAGAGRERPGGEQFFLLPPELSDQALKHGWTLARIQNYLFAETSALVFGDRPATNTGLPPVAPTAAHIHPVMTGGAGVKMTYLPLWMGGTVSVTNALIEP
ncbi:MAG: hypothetical protein EXQ87_02695 [Alphaproteobacteria bacterium]|nr:hypothetical protein [Alphaproteobacteria bacterium]